MDMHVIESIRKGFQRVVMHIPVPNVTNDAVPPVNFRTARKNSLFIEPGESPSVMKSSVAGGDGLITDAEKQQILDGEIIEVVEEVQLIGSTNAERVAQMDKRYKRVKAQMQARYALKLQYFGQDLNEL